MAHDRPAPRAYSQQDKDAFFRLLAERGNVSAVARKLGFVRVTCYKWANQAGIFTGKNVDAKREEFARLRASGLTRARAAAHVGSSDHSRGFRRIRRADDDPERVVDPYAGRGSALAEVGRRRGRQAHGVGATGMRTAGPVLHEEPSPVTTRAAVTPARSLTTAPPDATGAFACSHPASEDVTTSTRAARSRSRRSQWQGPHVLRS